ncbi:MAG: exodeoxyribonuclease VII large subunit [bacterium]
MKDEIFSVSSYLDDLNTTLKSKKAKIIGEVSGVQEYPGRSYLYFSIRDKKDQSTVKCFMWKNDYRISGVTIADGMEIIVTAYPNIYKPNGGLTLQVEQIELVGEGALKIAYEELKKKLESEGLFSLARKRAIPDYPQTIGVITSKSGAVINDFLTNVGKYGFEILFVDSKVEGQDAVKDLLSAVETLRKKDIDVLVIMRGGGSLESFLAFNNETLIRAVANFPVPVLTGIGHDKDIPLVSMVSDKNVSTPTAVANLLNSSWSEAIAKVRLAEEKIFSQFQSGLRDNQYMIENSHLTIEKSFSSLLDVFKNAEKTMIHAVVKIESQISRLSDMISRGIKDIVRGFETIQAGTRDLLVQSGKTIQMASPERQLSRGYSIVKTNGKVVRNVEDAPSGSKLDVMVSDGTIETKVI